MNSDKSEDCSLKLSKKSYPTLDFHATFKTTTIQVMRSNNTATKKVKVSFLTKNDFITNFFKVMIRKFGQCEIIIWCIDGKH